MLRCRALLRPARDSAHKSFLVPFCKKERLALTVHIIGAGLAGLAAALELQDVVIYEAGPACGGRCRSYFDRELGCRIDNGGPKGTTERDPAQIRDRFMRGLGVKQ